MWVRFPPRAPNMPELKYNENFAYVAGVALGDGNLSNPNGRAVRLRVTCDNKYPKLIDRIKKSIKVLLPENQVSLVGRKRNCTDVSCYSNKWEKLLGWRADGGSKYKQKVSIPGWIKIKKIYKIACLKGLIETDGSVYIDRGYEMVIFKTIIPGLAKDVFELIKSLGFQPHIYKLKGNYDLEHNFNRKPSYHVRISKRVREFLDLLQIKKN